nr:uncharacterized protein LOC128705499 [Cherax quadricarinatus]
MASLSRTCILCSDCHPRNILGVTTYIKEHVLITCKSVVKDYNVLDRRQERSWTTKSWNPFTSAAVYDPTTENIVAVFNNTILSRWKHDEDDVDKVKRLIFETPIHKLMVVEIVCMVFFTNWTSRRSCHGYKITAALLDYSRLPLAELVSSTTSSFHLSSK